MCTLNITVRQILFTPNRLLINHRLITPPDYRTVSRRVMDYLASEYYIAVTSSRCCLRAKSCLFQQDMRQNLKIPEILKFGRPKHGTLVLKSWGLLKLLRCIYLNLIHQSSMPRLNGGKILHDAIPGFFPAQWPCLHVCLPCRGKCSAGGSKQVHCRAEAEHRGL